MKQLFVNYFDCWIRFVDFFGTSNRNQFISFFLINLIIILSLVGLNYYLLVYNFLPQFDFPKNILKLNNGIITFNLTTIDFLDHLPNSITFLFSLLLAFMMAVTLPLLALIVRRLNDLKLSITNLLWILLPFFGVLILVIILIQKPRYLDIDFYNKL